MCTNSLKVENQVDGCKNFVVLLWSFPDFGQATYPSLMRKCPPPTRWQLKFYGMVFPCLQLPWLKILQDLIEGWNQEGIWP